MDFYSHACPFSAELSPSHPNPDSARSRRLPMFLFPSIHPPLLLSLAISHQHWTRSPMPGIFPHLPPRLITPAPHSLYPPCPPGLPSISPPPTWLWPPPASPSEAPTPPPSSSPLPSASLHSLPACQGFFPPWGSRSLPFSSPPAFFLTSGVVSPHFFSAWASSLHPPHRCH